MFLILASIPGS